ncbi:hypothetical protein RclHR1_15550005 [Rhizophagus clarus]|uniref:Uncharacterized protein n=1 Tax=Rhizophagus clarus TaxID=94130 RepID=A0A2Z6QH58_9GLOM|nr:hypothetical protein RclHR1_15550005 [Rhizophagus clarus]
MMIPKIFGYAQAFFIVLKSKSINDDNDPRNLATKYDFVNQDGTINNTTSIIQDPDSNTNLFNWFPTSLLAIIAEIELFYLLPYQKRNNKKWFPDWIYYDIPVTEIRKLINAIDNDQTVFNYSPIVSEGLRKLVVLTIDDKKQDNEKEQYNEKEQDNKEVQDNKLEKQIEQTREELIQQNIEFKQQMEGIMKYSNNEEQNNLEKK